MQRIRKDPPFFSQWPPLVQAGSGTLCLYRSDVAAKDKECGETRRTLVQMLQDSCHEGSFSEIPTRSQV